jgi:hypothetical protein
MASFAAKHVWKDYLLEADRFASRDEPSTAILPRSLEEYLLLTHAAFYIDRMLCTGRICIFSNPWRFTYKIVQ